MVESKLYHFGGASRQWVGMSPGFYEIYSKVPNCDWPITRVYMLCRYESIQKTIHLGHYPYKTTYLQKKLPNLNALPVVNNTILNKIWQYSLGHFGSVYRNVLTKNGYRLYFYKVFLKTYHTTTSEGIKLKCRFAWFFRDNFESVSRSIKVLAYMMKISRPISEPKKITWILKKPKHQ